MIIAVASDSAFPKDDPQDQIAPALDALVAEVAEEGGSKRDETC